MADTPSGLFAKVDPCAALVPGVRLATLNVALYEFLDREYGSDFGADLRRPQRRSPCAVAAVRPGGPARRGCAMARVVVVGGGFGGMAVAVRLAKLGHEVTLLERAERLGGALTTVEADGFTWDAGPTHTMLPAVLRDLFRKSGRPLERELELVPLEVLREHRFEDGSSVRLPGGSRAAQIAAVDELGEGLGRRWVDHVASYDDDWEVLRREYLERPWDRDHLPAPLAARLRSRETLAGGSAACKDERLQLMATHPATADGHEPRDVPAWVGVTAYVEQRFGAWTVPGGMAAITAGPRAATGHPQGRGPHRHRGARRARARRPRGRRDHRRRPPRRRRRGRRGRPASAAHARPARARDDARAPPGRLPPRARRRAPGPLPTRRCCTATRCSSCAPAAGPPTAGTRGRCTAAAGSRRTCWSRWRGAASTCAPQVVTRIDRSPRDLVELWGGSPLGVRWQGRGTTFRRLGPHDPVPGVYAAGAHATPGAGLPFVGLSAALVAQVVGPAQ